MTRGELNAQIKQLLRERHLLTAMDIVSLLEERGLVYNKTSVYRALERMFADGDICRQALGENQIFYELHQDEHDHLVCTRCGRITGVNVAVAMPQMVDSFQVEHHHLTLYGVCSHCRA